MTMAERVHWLASRADSLERSGKRSGEGQKVSQAGRSGERKSEKRTELSSEREVAERKRNSERAESAAHGR